MTDPTLSAPPASGSDAHSETSSRTAPDAPPPQDRPAPDPVAKGLTLARTLALGVVNSVVVFQGLALAMVYLYAMGNGFAFPLDASSDMLRLFVVLFVLAVLLLFVLLLLGICSLGWLLWLPVFRRPDSGLNLVDRLFFSFAALVMGGAVLATGWQLPESLSWRTWVGLILLSAVSGGILAVLLTRSSREYLVILPMVLFCLLILSQASRTAGAMRDRLFETVGLRSGPGDVILASDGLRDTLGQLGWHIDAAPDQAGATGSDARYTRPRYTRLCHARILWSGFGTEAVLRLERMGQATTPGEAPEQNAGRAARRERLTLSVAKSDLLVATQHPAPPCP